MAILKGYHHPFGSKIVGSVERIGREARLCLLAIRDNRGAGLLESPDRVVEGLGIPGIHSFLGKTPGTQLLYRIDQRRRARDAADRFCWNRHGKFLIKVGRGWETLGLAPGICNERILPTFTGNAILPRTMLAQGGSLGGVLPF